MPETDHPPAPGSSAAAAPRVHVVIPVFNRLEVTRACLRQLERQTYPALDILVCDGGSTDGSPEALRREFPRITLLSPAAGELWWSGATALGIAHVLDSGAPDGDFVMLLNNDTFFAEDFVARMVGAIPPELAALAPLITDAGDPTKLVDAGIRMEFGPGGLAMIDLRDLPPPAGGIDERANTLTGRGTLLRLSAIRRVGNLDHEALPHYLGDYDYFLRLAKAGLRLGVWHGARIAVDASVSGLHDQGGGPIGFARFRQYLTSLRSPYAVRPWLRFLRRHAPPGSHVPALFQQARFLFALARRTPAGWLLAPVAWLGRLALGIRRRLRG